MGLGGVLSTALSGLKTTEAALELVARNVANADTPGYTRKSLLRASTFANGQSNGVREVAITRQLDALLQRESRLSGSAVANSAVLQSYLSRVDQMFGVPGSEFSADAIYNQFTASLSELAATPDSTILQQTVLRDAQTLVQMLNQTTNDIQGLRAEADRALSGIVNDMNQALSQIERINTQIIALGSSGNLPADLLDERDRQVDILANFMDIRVLPRENGSISIFTESGTSLFDGTATKFQFDGRGSITADTLYSNDPTVRGVGTIIATAQNGFSFDLLQDGVIRSGEIAAYSALRDDILVEAQTQLDEFASSLALALSSINTAGTAATSGAATGLEADIGSMISGDRISLDVVDTVTGNTQTYTFIRVDDPTQLPLSASTTANPNDLVFGIDFSGGLAAAVSAMDAAVGANVSLTLSGSNLVALDDGVPNLTDIGALNVRTTASGLTGEGLSLSFFTDFNGGDLAYSDSLDGGPQKRGFAGRIAVSAVLKADPGGLIVSSTSPQTGSGDPTRPLFLLDQLTATNTQFSPAGSIGGVNAPFEGTPGDYLVRVIDFQAAQSADISRVHESRTIVATSLNDRLAKDTGVSLDQELSNLLILQNAYAANARILQAVDEIINTLLQI